LVEAIEDGVLHVRGEGPRIVLEAGGVNFDLKAESEQRALLDVMAELLSYLPGPLQRLAWSDPVQIEIAKKVFSPPPEEVRFAKKVLEAIPDGRGVHMIDGKMQDDATWKQCKVMVTLAEMLAEKDPELAKQYEL